jgi:hypothetical protein
MGPSLDCVLRRSRLPAVDLEKEALKQPKLTKKKVSGCESVSSRLWFQTQMMSLSSKRR